MNLNLYAYEGAWVMVDCGMMISNDTGADQVYVPDPAFLRDKQLSGLILTHAHEDHIGGIVDLWDHIRCPIYATPFTAAVVRRKFAESKHATQPQFKIFPNGSRFNVGPFDVEMIPITHSTVESHSVVLRTPEGAILHTGDWKLDPQPLLGPKTAEARFKALGDERVLAVVGDSTNAQIPGWSSSESEVRERLIDLISQENNRVACACFSSNIARLATFFEIARATNRHPVLVGRSLLRMVGAAQETGYLPRDLNQVPLHDAMYLPRHKVLLICTGSQGEERAALSRISRHQHRQIFLEEGDAIFFSSKVIPGNEEGIERLQERFVSQGVRVITEENEHIHVSGHPCVDELKQMYAWVKPEALIPVHGYPPHLMAHAEVGRGCGLKVLEIRNGDVVLINEGGPRVVEETPVGRVMRVEESWEGRRPRGSRGGRDRQSPARPYSSKRGGRSSWGEWGGGDRSRRSRRR
jgi:ribonuclease J